MQWSDVAGAQPGQAPWARVTIRHQSGNVSSLQNDAGQARYTARGTLFVQVFTPAGDGNTTGLTLAWAIVKAFRNARGAVWFRNQRIQDVGSGGSGTQTNVLVDFSYDD